MNLGALYASGSGVPQDPAKAIEWYLKAVEEGSVVAQYNLGLKYANGEGVEKDYVTAHMWYNVASANGDAQARRARDRIARFMPDDQIRKAKKLAEEWLAAHGE